MLVLVLVLVLVEGASALVLHLTLTHLPLSPSPFSPSPPLPSPPHRFLRSYPLVRMGFVLYLLVLHLWVFVVLGWQTHSLDLDLDLGSAPVSNKLTKMSLPAPP